jgi:hypothetical protein
MHLPLGLPSLWYLVHLVAGPGGVNVTGVSLPALPMVLVGHAGAEPGFIAIESIRWLTLIARGGLSNPPLRRGIWQSRVGTALSD